MSGLVERETRPHQVLKNPCVGCSRRCLGIKAACTCERHAQVPFAWFCIAFVWFCLYGNTVYNNLILKTFRIFLEPPNIRPWWKGASPRSTCTVHKVNMPRLAHLRCLRDSNWTWRHDWDLWSRRVSQVQTDAASYWRHVLAAENRCWCRESYQHPSPHLFEVVWSMG